MSLSRFFSACLFGHEASVRERDDQDRWIEVCPRCRQSMGRVLETAIIKGGPAHRQQPDRGTVTTVAVPAKKKRTATKGRDAKRAAATVGAKRQKPITLVEKKVS